MLFQHFSSENTFTVEGSLTVFQPPIMTSFDWQEAIKLLWMSFKSQLFLIKQYKYMFAVSKYKLVKQRHFTSKAVVKVTLDATVKQKASVAKKDKGKSREVTLQ
jgi:hypothetical protein